MVHVLAENILKSAQPNEGKHVLLQDWHKNMKNFI